MNLELQNKVIVFTGAAGYLGSAITKALISQGASVIAIDPFIEPLLEFKEQLPNDKKQHLELITNSTTNDPKSVDVILEKVEKQFGKIDTLINAAYPRTSDWHKSFEEIPFSSWQKNVDDHLNSYFLWSQKAADRMIKRKDGHIINFSSIYGLVGPHFEVYENCSGMTMPAAYSAIKGAISNFTRYLAAYLGPHGVRVNAICPGGVFDNQAVEFVSAYNKIVPLRRLASVEEVVGPVLFLVSDLSRYITGINLPVDGGWTAI